MDGFVWKYICLLTTTLYVVLLFSASVNTQSVVEFSVDSASVIVGQTVVFHCTSIDFNPTQNLLDIRFRDELLMQFVNGASNYFNDRSDMYYTTNVLVGDGKSRVQLTINQVNVDDTGDYTCSIIKVSPGEMLITDISTPIRLVVQLFPSPVCFAGEHPDISHSTDTAGQLIASRSGISVTLICSAQTQENDMSVLVEWSVSDGRMTEPGSYGSNSLTFISSQSDNGVDFTCTSSSPSVPNVAYQCKITVFTLDESRITSTISNIVTTTIANSVTTKPVPTTSTHVNPSTLTTETITKVSNHAVVVQPISTTMITDAVSRQTIGINPEIPTTVTVTNSTTTKAASELPLELIVGASGVTGLLLLILLVVIVCICVNKPSKRNRKRPNSADNVHLVVQRPSPGIDNLPRSAVDSLDSDIEVPLNGHHQSSTTYENTNRTLHNIEKESNQIPSSPATKSPTPRINVNNENAHFVLPPLQESTRNSIANANGGIRNFVANKDAKDSRSNNLNSLGGKDHNSENAKDNNKENNQTVTPVQHSSSDAPLYAYSNKNTNKSVSSSVSDVDSIPTYATVNRNRDRSGKVQSRVPPAVAVKNKGHKKGSLHYADVEFS